MDAVSDPSVTEVVAMCGAQLLKTELLINAIGYYSNYDPCPMMLLQPTEQMAEAFSKDRIAPSIRDSPSMRNVFGDPAAKHGGNTILHKQFAGGHLTIAGANSPASLASRPIRVVLFDEVDRYPDSAGSEGDPVEITTTRTSNFWNRRIVLVSTPTIKGHSRIESAFEETDQRYYQIPCPHCGHSHKIVWGNVVWEKGDEANAKLVCPSCTQTFTNAQKNEAVKVGKWVASAPFSGRAGFHISQLYSPWRSLGELVDRFLRARGNPERMKSFVNTVLGESYEEAGESISETDIEERAETYEQEVPGRVLMLTVGADTQDDRIEAECIGWGAGEESWSIDYAVFPGDPDIPAGQDGSPWDGFLDFVRKKRRHARGFDIVAQYTCIDTAGHKTQAVYNFVRRHKGDRIFGIVGRSGPDRPIISGASRKKSGKTGRPIDLYIVGHDQAKGSVVDRLKLRDPGPGYCHFPKGRDTEYYRQLTSDKLVTSYKKGKATRKWEKIEGRRSEALDCRCYGYAAMVMGNPQWDKLALRMKRRGDLASKRPKSEAPAEPEENAAEAMEKHQESPEAPKKARSRRNRSGWQIRTW